MTSLPVPQHIKYRVDQRDGHVDRSTGRYLGKGRNLHHRKLRSRGGENSISNLVTLSGSGTTGTHGYMHANPLHATRYGYIVPSWADPARIPIRLTDALGRHQWAYLNHDGSVTNLELEYVTATMRALGIWGEDETF